MFNLNDTMRYFLCPGRTDMRKGISSLCGVVHEKMNSEVKNGDVFIFIGSSRRLMKLLHAEDGGMVMYVKRLEAGRFKLPEYDPQSNSYHSSHWSRSLKVRRFCSEGITMICLIIGIRSSSLTSPIIVRSVKVSTDNRISSA